MTVPREQVQEILRKINLFLDTDARPWLLKRRMEIVRKIVRASMEALKVTEPTTSDDKKHAEEKRALHGIRYSTKFQMPGGTKRSKRSA